MSLSGSRIRIITCITQIWLLMLVPSVKTIFAETLSNEAQISILTVDSGKEIWTVFGHTAIRIHDPINNIDEVYNYGTFDFDQNRFYLKFLRGNLIYYLSRDSFDHFLKSYTAENRTIWEQQLLFQSEVLQKLYDSLLTNYHSGNRDYYYNFFEDNCTTRILNLIIAFASEKYSEEYLLQPVNSTYRKELKPILLNRPWIAFGVNLLLGRYGDQHINLRQSMFLPVTLMKKLPGTGWATEGVTIHNAKTAPSQAKEFFMPITIFWIVAFALAWEKISKVTNQRFSDKIDIIVYSIAGTFGIFLFFLKIYSLHPSLQTNMNLLWANPLLVIYAFAINFRWKKITFAIALLYSTILFFILITWNKIPQKFPLEIMPLLLILAFRSMNRIFRFVNIKE